MALQLLNMPNRAASLGQSFGQALGGGLSGGLQELAEHKIQKMQHNKRIEGLAALGLPSSYANLDPRILEQVVHQRLQEPSQMAFAQGLQSILGGNVPQQPQDYSQQTMVHQHQMPIPSQSQAPMTRGEQLGQSIFGNQMRMNQVPTSGQPAINQRQLPPQVQQSSDISPELASRLNPQQALQLAQLGLQKQAVAQKERSAQGKFEREQIAKQQAASSKETLPYYNKILEEDKAAKKIDVDTERMIKLINKGRLPNPVFYKLAKDIDETVGPVSAALSGAAVGAKAGTFFGRFGGLPGIIGGAAAGGLIGGTAGVGIKALASAARWAQQTPDLQEFEKLSANFISGAKAIFGSRVTDQDLKAFMLTVPQLSNTDDGKRAIIRNIQLMNKASHVRANAMKKIIRANDGHRPANLSILVEEVAEPELDKIASEFINEGRVGVGE